MSPSEVWLIVEAKRPKVMGGLHEDDFTSIARKRDELAAQGIKVL